ncbi:MAG: NUDIX domain-containing protein [Candidatus Gracilibacteria bacterium]|nr:NUDIX domain-containing protein [Candidatus Gracilibacteria bacterium]
METKFIKSQVYSPDYVDVLGINTSPEHNERIYEVRKKIGEILDIFTEQIAANGLPIFTKSGEIGKQEAHNIGALHLASHIWIYNSRGEVLIQQRASDKWPYPNLWDFSAAGHVDSGEDFITGGLRETKEEIGLDVMPEDLKMIGIYREEITMPMNGEYWHNNELDGVFILQHEVDLEKLKLQKKEVKRIEFMPIDQLEREWKEWSDEDISAKYTPKSKEYRNMVITEIRKALRNLP